MRRIKYGLSASVICFSTGVLAHASGQKMVDLSSDFSHIQQYSNEDQPNIFSHPKRLYAGSATRVIRMDLDLSQAGVNCDDVNQTINAIFLKKILDRQFIYNILIGCTVDESNGLASRFVLHSYFDTLDDETESFLNEYEKSYEGYNFYGTPFHIEKAKGLAVALEISAVLLEGRDENSVLRLSRDFHTLNFNNNYSFTLNFVQDIAQRFYSQQHSDIVPFINQWFYPSLGELYEPILSKANMVELFPEKIFLMDETPFTFTSRLHYYYKHRCIQYENQKCLV